MTLNPPIRVFLVDDHEIVRSGIRALLDDEADVEVVGEAATAAGAVTALLHVRPDVTLLDLHLPDGNGIEVCRAVRSRDASARFLVLTSDDDDAAVLAAILAGADGYILKHVRGHDLLVGVRAVAAGRPFLSQHARHQIVDRMRRQERRHDGSSRLSAQEDRVLDLLAQGLTNREIAVRLALAEKTVKNYVSSLLTKLGMTRRTEAAAFAARRLERASRPRADADNPVRY